jgi:hypothetical protein
MKIWKMLAFAAIVVLCGGRANADANADLGDWF